MMLGVTTTRMPVASTAGARACVDRIDHQRAGDVRVEPGDTDHRRLVPQLLQHAIGRALQRSAADDGRDGDHGVAPRVQQVVEAGSDRNGAMDTSGFEGATTTTSLSRSAAALRR
jgi:hypothetical protein